MALTPRPGAANSEPALRSSDVGLRVLTGHKGLQAFFERGTKAGIRPDHASKLGRLLARLDVATCDRDGTFRAGACIRGRVAMAPISGTTNIGFSASISALGCAGSRMVMVRAWCAT